MLELSVLLNSQQAQGSIWSTVIMVVAFIAIFYLFMIRPQQKRQKELREAREAMKVGDKVVTAGGIHGKIKEISETYFLLEISEGVKIRVEKNSVFASAQNTPAQ